MSPFAAAGILAGVLTVISSIPYVRDVVVGRTTRPHRASWFIWSVLGVIAFASQRAGGATWSLVLTGTGTTLVVLIFLLAIPHGVGGLTRFDLVLLAVAGIGLIAWRLSSEPTVATVLVVATDAVGVVLMLPKTWRDPSTETLATYVIGGLGAACGTVSVGALDLALLLYPAYIATSSLLLAGVIAGRRRRLLPA